MSMLLANIFEGLITFLSNLLIDIVTLLMNAIIALIGELIFGLVLKVLYFVDFFQSLFKRLVGLDTVWVGNNASNNDIVLALITSSQIMDVFVALTILSIAIMFIATIVQIIRSEYTTEKSENSKSAIFKNSLKSMVMFVAVPLSVVMGIILSQFLLKALDAATTKTTTAKISNSVFSASCSSANKLLVKNNNNVEQLYPEVKDNIVVWNYKYDNTTSGQVFLGYKVSINSPTISLQQIPSTPTTDVTETVSYKDNMASIIDNCFASGYYIIVAENEEDLFNNEVFLTKTSMAYKFAIKSNLKLTLSSDGRYLVGEKQSDGTLKLNVFEATNSGLAVQFYDTNSINYVILAFGTFICAYIMLMAAIGIVMRLFKSVLLYVVAPPVVGLMPLDGGNAFGEWRKAFIANIISAYGTIISLNLFFLMLPFFQSMNFFNAGNAISGIDLSFQNSLMRLILVITGLITVKEGGSLISKLIGADDAVAAGGDMAKRIGNTVVTAATVATGVGALAKSAVTKGASLALKAGAKLGDKFDAKKGKTTSNRQIRNRGRARDLANKLDQKSSQSMKNVRAKSNALGKKLGAGLGLQMRGSKPPNPKKEAKKEQKAKDKQKKFDAQQKSYKALKAQDKEVKKKYKEEGKSSLKYYNDRRVAEKQDRLDEKSGRMFRNLEKAKEDREKSQEKVDGYHKNNRELKKDQKALKKSEKLVRKANENFSNSLQKSQNHMLTPKTFDTVHRYRGKRGDDK